MPDPSAGDRGFHDGQPSGRAERDTAGELKSRSAASQLGMTAMTALLLTVIVTPGQEKRDAPMPMPTSRTIQRPETIVTVTEARRGTIEGDGLVVLTVKGGRIDLTPEEADKLADHLTATADQSRQPASEQTQRQRRITVRHVDSSGDQQS